MSNTLLTENPAGVTRKGTTIIKVTQSALDKFATTDDYKSVFDSFWLDATEIGAEAFAGLDFTNITKSSKIRQNVDGDKLVSRTIEDKYAKPTPAFYIPSQINIIGNGAFMGAKGLESVQIGYRFFDPDNNNRPTFKGASVIGDNAFASIEGLEAVFVATNPTIGRNAFAGNNFKHRFENTTSNTDGFSFNDYGGYTSLSEEEIKARLDCGYGLRDLSITDYSPVSTFDDNCM